MKYDIITFGSATLDIFVLFKESVTLKKEKKKGIFLPIGEKIEGEKIIFYSGGGGTNTAATFANQGLRVAFCGMIGKDLAGKFILEDLKRYKINKELIFETEKRSSNCSVIFIIKEGNLILPYRGAARILGIKDIPFEKLKTEWFYLAPLSGKLRKDFLKIINLGRKRGIKIALNPSKYQLATPGIKEALRKVDILVLNQEEASVLTGLLFQKENEIFKKLDKWTEGICIMTKGEKGVVVSDGKFLYKAPALKTEVTDETGAGDAFGSGFVAEYIKSKNITLAIQFAMANASANLKKIGAKEGLLRNREKWQRVKVAQKLLK